MFKTQVLTGSKLNGRVYFLLTLKTFTAVLYKISFSSILSPAATNYSGETDYVIIYQFYQRWGIRTHATLSHSLSNLKF
jgi:hypothetical protein